PSALPAVSDPSVAIYGDYQVHYCYRDSNGAIWDARYDNPGWSATQVTGASGQVPAAPTAGGGPVVFVYTTVSTNQMHYCYRDTNGYLQDAVWNGNNWGYQTL